MRDESERTSHRVASSVAAHALDYGSVRVKSKYWNVIAWTIALVVVLVAV